MISGACALDTKLTFPLQLIVDNKLLNAFALCGPNFYIQNIPSGKLMLCI